MPQAAQSPTGKSPSVVDKKTTAASPQRPKKDFFWSNQQYMHIARNQEMLKKYPQIKKLMGYEPVTKYYCIAIVAIQAVLGYYAPHMSWFWFVAFAYTVGATINSALYLATHEVTHNLAFKAPWMNDAFAILINFPIVAPFAMMFKTYHADHHRYLGWDGVDPDLPADLEARLLSNFFGKLFFLTFQILFYTCRPMMVRMIKFQFKHVLNYAVMLGTHAYIAYAYSYWSTAYWLLSGFFAGSLHPLAGHFLAEHYMFDGESQQETFSYYGPLNKVMFNGGYHVEHHDFPHIPWTRIAQVRKIAPEYYDNLKVVDSWPMLLVRFLFDPKVSSYSRLKREKNAWQRSVFLPTTQGSGAVLNYKDAVE